MKLYYTKSSPFARKVLINAIEAGIINKIETVDLAKSGSFQTPQFFEKVNPLFKIPVLEIEEKDIIIDSPIICEYIDSIAVDRKLLPETQKEKFFQLKLQALADGILDAAVLRRYESLREPLQQSQDYDQKQLQKIQATLHFFNENIKKLSTPYMIGEVALMCALGYLDFRFSKENWRAENNELDHWFKKAQSWQPFQTTTPS